MFSFLSANSLILVLLSTSVYAQTPPDNPEPTIFPSQLPPLMSYAQGVHVAKLIAPQFKRQLNLGIKLNKQDFIKGFSDYLLEKNQLPNNEVKLLSQQMYHLMQVNHLKNNAKIALDNLDEGQAFLQKNRTNPKIKFTASGLQYQINTTAKGMKPKLKDVVTLRFNASRIDGSTISSSDVKNKPLNITVNKLFKGLQQGLQIMSVGANYTFFIPSKLAYGITGDVNLNIGPNEVVIYQVELLNIQPATS